MKNQVYTGTPTSRRFALCPSTIKAGDPVFLGSEPGVALDDYSAATGGTVFLTGGSFNLTVVGESQASPQVGAAIKPGGKVYGSGTLDTTTNVTSITLLSAITSGVLFGYVDPSYTVGVGSAATDTAAIVRLAGSE